jgi:hypothetical protein
VHSKYRRPTGLVQADYGSGEERHVEPREPVRERIRKIVDFRVATRAERLS